MNKILNSENSFKKENLHLAIVESMESMESMVAYLDQNFIYQYVNTACSNWLGLKPEEVIGKPLTEFLSAFEFNQAKPRLEGALQGNPQKFEIDFPHRLGGHRHLQLNFNPDFSEDRSVRGVFVVIHDLTDLHSEEATVRERKRQFRKILDSIPAMIGYCDRNLNVVAGNKAYSEFYSLPMEYSIPVKKLIGDVDFARLEPHMREALQGKAQWFEREVSTSENPSAIKHLLVTCTPEFENREVIGFYVTITDTTEIKSLHADLRRQHDFYSQIINSIDEGFIVLNADGKTIFCNDAAKRILEIEPQKSIVKQELKAFHEDGSPVKLEDLPSSIVLKTGVAHKPTLYSVVTAKNNAKWLNASAVPFQGTFDGQEAKVLVTWSDITTKINRRHFLTSIIQNVPGVIYQFHMNESGAMTFPFLAPQANAMFEITEEDKASNPTCPMNLVHPEDLPNLIVKIKESAQTLNPFEWNGRIVTASGRTIWLTVKSIPRRELNNGITWDGVMLDVTNETLVKEQLDMERAKSAHSLKLAALGEIAAGVAHEIHNPLTIISGMNQLMFQSKNDPEILNKRITSISKACDRIEKIVGSLKKFARQGSNQKTICSVTAILEESESLWMIKAKNAKTEVIFENGSNSSILCNQIEIEQILINLVSNAIDAVGALEQKWVKVRTLDRGEDVVIRITDAGNGIPTTVASKLFSPFFTTEVAGAGTGLGLNISQNIAKAHGGNIALVVEEPNTCFELTLPRAQQLAELA